MDEAPPPAFFRKIRFLSEYAFLLASYYILRFIPFGAGDRLIIRLAGVIGPRTPWHKRVIRNLDLVLPEKTPAEKKIIGKKAWQNLASVGIDFGRAPERREKSEIFTYDGGEILEKYGLSDKPVLFFSGHIATWEMFRVAAKQKGVAVAMSYRGFNNPYFEKLARFFMDHGVAPLFTKTARGAREMILYLLRGGKILLLTDHRFGNGITAPFFGKPARTLALPAALAVKHDIPLIPVCVQRKGYGKFHVIIKPPLCAAPLPNESQEDRILRLTTDMNAALESFIRETPGDWFWHHRRWK